MSLDVDRKSWIKSIEQDKLDWLNVSDLKGKKNGIAILFNIDAIPDNILIDKEGRVIARKIRSEELEQILNNLL